jgi:hypothetical protein
MRDYNRAELAAVAAAERWIVDVLESRTSSGAFRWREFLRLERRERSSIAVARALMVGGFLQGWRDNPTAETLAGYSVGIAVAAMLGAEAHRLCCRRGPSDSTGFVAALEAAAAAHNAAIGRRLEAARRECVGEE